jgi:hypothetical protein
MVDEKTRREGLRRLGYARRARQIADALRDDADALERPYAVPPEVFARIDGCRNAYEGGGSSPELTAAVRFMFWVDEGLALEQKSRRGRASAYAVSAFNGARDAERGFSSEYPELAVDLSPEDWRQALDARSEIGKRGGAKPWTRLADILGKTRLRSGRGKIDGENLKKACVGRRNTPGRVLGTKRW